MFFDAFGRILERAGEVLRSDVRAEVEDEFVRQQVDAIALIVSEMAAAWPGLFAALERQNAILAETLSRSSSEVVANGSDPLRRNADLLASIDAAMCALHARDDAQAEASLRAMRRGLVEAAAIEQTLLSGARERSGMASTRRL